MIRQTSLTAYKKIVDTIVPGLRKTICLTLLRAGNPMTSSEIGKEINRPRDSVSPRMRELVVRDLVYEHSTRACEVTGESAIAFWLTGRSAQAPTRTNKTSSKVQTQEELERGRIANKLLKELWPRISKRLEGLDLQGNPICGFCKSQKSDASLMLVHEPDCLGIGIQKYLKE